ncbi:hypothetical protein EVAR_44289_1 [Eumeta japonica]|uniref:Uncharacterized protein n=1 Tax=Eumeta variegata TaxID=151549 RepID=A0A4C1WPH8_EUMVA|nr:hypothetical protein EVAR_44289_1 [Eumeta japonica]
MATLITSAPVKSVTKAAQWSKTGTRGEKKERSGSVIPAHCVIRRQFRAAEFLTALTEPSTTKHLQTDKQQSRDMSRVAATRLVRASVLRAGQTIEGLNKYCVSVPLTRSKALSQRRVRVFVEAVISQGLHSRAEGGRRGNVCLAEAALTRV